MKNTWVHNPLLKFTILIITFNMEQLVINQYNDNSIFFGLSFSELILKLSLIPIDKYLQCLNL